MKIIDFHSHLGNILYPGGGELIDRKNVNMPLSLSAISLSELLQHRSRFVGEALYDLLFFWSLRVERARNAAATLENMSRSLDKAGIDYTVCLPIAPNVTYRDLAAARPKDGRILPFTSIDFTMGEDAANRVLQDVEEGALGLKLHPIIQRKRLDDPLQLAVLQAFEKTKKPVLTHAGVSRYYPGRESSLHQPENGKIEHVEALVKTFPRINFVIGHAGLSDVDRVRSNMGGLKNVWVDTSFQSPKSIAALIDDLGPEKVLFASDWPYGYRKPALKAAKAACRGDRALEEMIFYRNAAELLGL